MVPPAGAAPGAAVVPGAAPGDAAGAVEATLLQPSSLSRNSTLSTDCVSSNAWASTPVGAPSWWLGAVSSGANAGSTVGCTGNVGAPSAEQLEDCACAMPANANKVTAARMRFMFVPLLCALRV